MPAMRAAGGGTLLFTGGGFADFLPPELATLSLGKVTPARAGDDALARHSTAHGRMLSEILDILATGAAERDPAGRAAEPG
jgi:hypothetical protein